jgi:hypothetical protein
MRSSTAILLTTLMCCVGACTASAPAPSVQRTTVEPSRSGIQWRLLLLVESLPVVDIEEAPEALSLVAFSGLPFVADGYAYTLYHEPAADHYWLAEVGGIGGWARWRGPVTANNPLLRELLELVLPMTDDGRFVVPRLEARQSH